MNFEKTQSSDPKDHARKIADALHQLKDHCREDVGKVDDPRARALFETTAEVLGGLEKAMNDFRAAQEEAWRPSI